jgi:hypothetical protein
MSIKPDDLIPPDSELAQMLMQWSEDTDSRTWNIANTTNDLIAELEGGPITRMDVYRAVATRCKGQKPNTIRRWAECAWDFPRDIQEQYSQLLSFQHFKASRRLFKEGYTPSIDYALDWCVSGNDMKLSAGRFHTVGDMLANFLPEEKDKTPLQRYWNKVKDTLYDHLLLVDNDSWRNQALSSWREMEYCVKRIAEIEALDKSENDGTI